MKRLANLLFMNRKERKAIESKTHQTKQQMRRENITQRQDAKKERQIAKVISPVPILLSNLDCEY
jgi:dephospho-CoA kinase